MIHFFFLILFVYQSLASRTFLEEISDLNSEKQEDNVCLYGAPETGKYLENPFYPKKLATHDYCMAQVDIPRTISADKRPNNVYISSSNIQTLLDVEFAPQADGRIALLTAYQLAYYEFSCYSLRLNYLSENIEDYKEARGLNEYDLKKLYASKLDLYFSMQLYWSGILTDISAILSKTTGTNHIKQGLLSKLAYGCERATKPLLMSPIFNSLYVTFDGEKIKHMHLAETLKLRPATHPFNVCALCEFARVERIAGLVATDEYLFNSIIHTDLLVSAKIFNLLTDVVRPKRGNLQRKEMLRDVAATRASAGFSESDIRSKSLFQLNSTSLMLRLKALSNDLAMLSKQKGKFDIELASYNDYEVENKHFDQYLLNLYQQESNLMLSTNETLQIDDKYSKPSSVLQKRSKEKFQRSQESVGNTQLDEEQARLIAFDSAQIKVNEEKTEIQNADQSTAAPLADGGTAHAVVVEGKKEVFNAGQSQSIASFDKIVLLNEINGDGISQVERDLRTQMKKEHHQKVKKMKKLQPIELKEKKLQESKDEIERECQQFNKMTNRKLDVLLEQYPDIKKKFYQIQNSGIYKQQIKKTQKFQWILDPNIVIGGDGYTSLCIIYRIKRGQVIDKEFKNLISKIGGSEKGSAEKRVMNTGHGNQSSIHTPHEVDQFDWPRARRLLLSAALHPFLFELMCG